MARKLVISLLAGSLLTGCGASTTGPARVQVVQPNPPAAAPPVAVTSSPTLSSAPVSAQLPQNDVSARVVATARAHFDRGTALYTSGWLRQARTEFDAALDLLLEFAAVYPADERIKQEMNAIVTRVHSLELAAIRDGDGLTDQSGDHAAIDDLALVPTFPAPIDPKRREAVEEELKGTKHDLPIEINDRVLSFLEYYQNGRGRRTMEVGLERAGKYRPMMERILSEEDVPLDLIYLSQAESAFLPRALSRAKARGLWQFIPSRGKEYGLRQSVWIDERSDPEKATRAAARHLHDLYEEFEDWYLAMAAYNAGPFRVESAMRRTGATTFWELADKRALPKETINYVPTILALAIIGRNPDKYGFGSVAPAPAMDVERVQIKDATDLRVIAEGVGLPVEQLKELNPHVLRWTTPPNDSEFELILPGGYSDKFNANVASLPASERILFLDHVVKRGETLSAISRKYGLTVAELTQANNISVKKALQVGQALLIPVSGAVPPPAARTASAATPASAKTTAASPTSVKTSAPASPTTHTVRRGDTLSSIAARYGITVSQLKTWNKLSSNTITVGRKLQVSAPVTAQTNPVLHEVRQGETLNKIASEYNTTVNAILAWNQKDDLSVIHPGDQITIFPGN